VTPAQTWLLIAVGIPTVMLAAWWITHLLEGRDPEPVDTTVTRERCECGRYLFICDAPHQGHAHEYRDDGTVHRPDLCQPADEAL
jgi:hypothetical protein